MDLFATPDNPIPADPIVSAVRTDDGLTLRVVRWVAPRHGRGTVFIAMGRSEFIEQYFEIVADLRARRFDVVILDWRGQGQSDREIAWLRRGHVSHFDAYQRDLVALETQILRPFTPRPWFALGHSMGGAILLDQAHRGRSPFERIVLSAPMIDLPLRYRKSIERLTSLLASLGLAAKLVPGGTETSIFAKGFPDNPLTSDAARYQRTALASDTAPDFVVGAPTIGWLAAAFRLMARFQEPRFAIETMTPILIVAAGADRIVSTKATERFAARLKTGRCITLADARHEVIMERDSIRDQFWAAFDAFIPGQQNDLGTPRPAAEPTSRGSDNESKSPKAGRHRETVQRP